ncbi:hypothetical protein JAU75_06465 [Ochrobactrum sp. Q0168]|uniref:ribonuclease domain-containing protein n=1 Tax=Ochrobactrum sp. Q0168 TaxID=2793241 RepID=UPI0018EA328D|nr:hypothetical protein [Ochrobactrum sp. Q0168]
MNKLLAFSAFVATGLMLTINCGVARPVSYCASGISPKNNPDEYDDFRNAKDQLEKYLKGKGQKPTVFNNHQGILPNVPRMTYYEFDLGNDRYGRRGRHRAITGYDGSSKRTYYYTDDHYSSFCMIR